MKFQNPKRPLTPNERESHEWGGFNANRHVPRVDDSTDSEPTFDENGRAQNVQSPGDHIDQGNNTKFSRTSLAGRSDVGGDAMTDSRAIA